MTKAELPALADDIASLRSFADTAGFDYVDVSAREAHRDALARWSLMSELDAFQAKRGPTPEGGEHSG